MIYTRLVFFNIALLIAPIPVQNIIPPANDKAAFIIVDVSGEIDGIIINTKDKYKWKWLYKFLEI